MSSRVLISVIIFALSGSIVKAEVKRSFVHGDSRYPVDSIKTINVKDAGGIESNDLIPVLNRILSETSGYKRLVITIPSGTWTLKPSKTNFVRLKSNISFIGQGAGTILKVVNNTGDYGYIFSNESQQVRNVAFTNFRIDQNGANNPGSNIIVGDLSKSQLIFYISNDFDNISFEKLNLYNVCGVNTISANGEMGKNVRISDCTIRWKKGRSVSNEGKPRYYDNSAIYLNCVGQKVLRNKIFADDVNAEATAAIETHNGMAVVSNNYIKNYQTGVNIVNESSRKTRAVNNITVSNNQIEGAARAIMLYAITKGYSLSGVNIISNSISLNQVKWNQDGIGIGIAADLGVNSDKSERLAGIIEKITISDNKIVFEPDTRKAIPNDYLSAGISLTGNNPVSECTITNNTISNAPLKAISVVSLNNKPISNVRIENNTIKNCGANDRIATVKQGYRSAFYLGENLTGITINNNHVIDTGATNRIGGYLFYRGFKAGARSSNVKTTNNKVTSRYKLLDNLTN